MSPLQKGHVTAAAQRSQRKMPERVAPTHHASPRIFLKFSARSASRRCVFAAKSLMHRLSVEATGQAKAMPSPAPNVVVETLQCNTAAAQICSLPTTTLPRLAPPHIKTRSPCDIPVAGVGRDEVLSTVIVRVRRVENETQRLAPRIRPRHGI